jgi:putative transcriptional regulator
LYKQWQGVAHDGPRSKNMSTPREGVVTLQSTLSANGRTRRGTVSVPVAITLILLALWPGTSLVGIAFSGQHAALLPLRIPVTFPLSDGFRSEASLAKGKFLVASRQLRDPNFSETVVLLIEYGSNGAMGLIINRPSELALSTVFPEMEGLQQQTDTLYIGGPVARSRMLLLIRSDNQPEESHRVVENIYISSSRTVLQQMFDDADRAERFRVYAGHAGWASGQLDREVSRGGWHVLQADTETVFDMAPSEIWPELIRRTAVLWARLLALDPNVRNRRPPPSTP